MGVFLVIFSYFGLSSNRKKRIFEGGSNNEYPGTATVRMQNIQKNIISLTSDDLSRDWTKVRKSLLLAGGMKDDEKLTGHSFNDFNHCDLTAMSGEMFENDNNGVLSTIAYHNPLGDVIQKASIKEVGPGGSWTTCMIGCNKVPPNDVAHIQFRSRISFKLVWCPSDYTTFVLVDDDGNLLNKGTPSGLLPDIEERKKNYELTRGSKYSMEADKISSKR